MGYVKRLPEPAHVTQNDNKRITVRLFRLAEIAKME